MKTFLKIKRIWVNLLIMTFVWMVTHFNLFLVHFLISTFERIWLTAIFANISDLIGYIFAGSLIYKFGIKVSLCSSFILTALGGLAILIFGLQN